MYAMLSLLFKKWMAPFVSSFNLQWHVNWSGTQVPLCKQLFNHFTTRGHWTIYWYSLILHQETFINLLWLFVLLTYLVRPLRRSDSLKVTDFGTNRKLIYDFYLWLILTYLLSYTVNKLWLIIGQIFASESGVSHFNVLASEIPANIAINDTSLKTRFFCLHFCSIKYWCILITTFT